jgi:hypothetical protein
MMLPSIFSPLPRSLRDRGPTAPARTILLVAAIFGVAATAFDLDPRLEPSQSERGNPGEVISMTDPAEEGDRKRVLGALTTEDLDRSPPGRRLLGRFFISDDTDRQPAPVESTTL